MFSAQPYIAIGDLGMEIRGVLALILLTAALLKLSRDAAASNAAIVEVLGLPQRPLLKAAASGIPIVEGGLAVWLLSGALAVGALAVTALLLALFTGILSVAVIRGYRGACACFGGNEERVGATAVAFDVCLVVLSLVALLVETGRTSPSSAITDLSWIEMIGIVIVGAALIGIRRLLGDVESIQHMLRSRE